MEIRENHEHAVRSGSLDLMRIPGASGPVVRVSGELTFATVETLRRELDLLASIGHPTLTLNLSRCEKIDAEGVLVLLDLYSRLTERGQRLMVVAGDGAAGRLLRLFSLDEAFPIFPTESAAELALRGGGPAGPGPGTWEAARQGSLHWWQAIRDAAEQQPAEQIMRNVLAMHPLCVRAEEQLQQTDAAGGAHGGVRCLHCPLFDALGGGPENVGCRSIHEAIGELLRSGNRTAARQYAAEVVRLVETMPLPAAEVR